jgi:hypothetical protein
MKKIIKKLFLSGSLEIRRCRLKSDHFIGNDRSKHKFDCSANKNTNNNSFSCKSLHHLLDKSGSAPEGKNKLKPARSLHQQRSPIQLSAGAKEN